MIERLQYITQDHPTLSHSQLCEEACKSGVKWVQLRMKNVDDPTYLAEAKKCRTITKQYGAKLIINDDIEIAQLSFADGVHLGLNDTNTFEARRITGDGFIIGGTANTPNDIIKHYHNGVNYVGVGPYRFTKTKENLSPILGILGYENIISELKKRNISIPIIAIGGIEINDIDQLKKIGIYGVAVSGLITNSENRTKLVKEINNKLL